MLARLGAGAPLDQATASRMAAAFGTSFADVRIHADGAGGALAQEQGAHAFTIGAHIAFAPGRYQPGTVEGDALLGHELTHVLQQRGTTPTRPQRKAVEARAGVDAAEHDADRGAAAVVHQLHGGGKAEKIEPAQGAGLGVQRWVPSVNEGEAEALGFHRQDVTLHGDRFALELHRHAPKGPMDLTLLKIVIRYAGRDDADHERITAQLRLPAGKSPNNAKVTADKPTDWTDLTLDVFGDGSWLGGIHHTVVELAGWTPKSRAHSFAFKGPGDSSPRQDVTVRSADAVPIDAAQTAGDPKPEAGPGLKPDVAGAAAKLTLDDMLSDPRFALDATRPPWAALRKKLAAATTKAVDADAATRLPRLQDTLSHARPVFLALGAASNPDAYLPDLADTALHYVAEVRRQYEVALAGMWDGPVQLGPADAAFNALWHRLTALYLQHGKGVDAMVKGGQSLAQDIASMTGSGEKPFDRIRNQLGVGKGGSNVLHTAEQVEIVRREFASGGKGSLAKVTSVVEDAQVIAGLGTLLVSDQLFHRFKSELAGIAGTVVDKTPGTRNITRVCSERIAALEALAQPVEDALAAARTQDELAAAIRTAGKAAVSKFQALANSDDYKHDLKDIQSRIKTVKVLQTLAKVLAIMGVAAFTGGAAGAAVGSALEGMGAGVAGAGAFTAEVATFTLMSRLGNDLAFGKNETSLGEDLVTNALMMGTLKKAAQVYGKVFKLLADPRKYKTAYAVGGAMTGFVALQLFAEVHALVKTGHAMDWDDRMRGLLSNALMMSAMALGGHLVKVATTNPEMHALALRNTGPALRALDTQVAALAPQLEQIRAGGPNAADLAAGVVPKIQALWQKQLEVFADAVAAEQDPAARAQARERFQATTEAFNRELARLDLKLASSGIDVQMAPGAGPGAHLFEPIRPGFVKIKPGAKPILDDFYRENGGKLEPVPGKDGLYRGTDASGETFFADAGKAESFLDDGAHTGAVKGDKVYAENTFVKDGKEQTSRLNAEKIRNALKGAVKNRSHGAKLTFDSATMTNAGGTMKLEVPTTAGTAEVAVQLTMKPKQELAASSAHEGDAGPARLELKHSAGGAWTAKIEVSEGMRPEDVQFAIDHELNEAAEIIRRHPGGEPKGGFGPEMQAGVMKAGATTGEPTAHDVAGAQEIVDLYKDAQNKPKDSPARKQREAVLDRALEAQGLKEPSQIATKLELLRKAGAPEALIKEVRQVEVERIRTERCAAQGHPTAFSSKLIDHLLYPTDTGAAGIYGGHADAELVLFSEESPVFALLEQGKPKTVGGTTYRRYKQYKWQGTGPKPKRGSPEAPGGAKFDAKSWQPAGDPKTTFNNPSAFLADAEAGYQSWLTTAPNPLTAQKIRFTTPAGVEITAYITDPTPPFVIGSMFPEGAWLP